MKRVKAACIFQTLIFAQKEDCGLSSEMQKQLNEKEIETYKKTLERSRTRYQITQQTCKEDGSIEVRVRKQYNDKADVSEYFEG